MGRLSPDRQRERLKGLMVIRIVLVTAFLGSTVALDATAFAELSEPRNATLVGLVVATYVLTIGYAAALSSNLATSALANIQLGGDLLITTVLALVTGGFDSIFLFFFHLTIINAAIVVGQRAAIVVAALTALCMIYFATITLGWLPHPILTADLTEPAPLDIAYEVLVNSFAGFLVAVLSGQLAARLGRANIALQREKSNVAELRALNRNILSSISSGLLTIDDDGLIIFFNRAAEEITGLESSRVLGHPLEQLFPQLAAIAADHDPDDPDPRLESVYTRHDGDEVYLGFSLSPLQNRDRHRIGQIIIFQDLSDIKEMEARMKRSERLAAVGELSAAIAHEIRNPLASISGSVEMLDGNGDDDDDRLLMDIIVREVDRLDHLIIDFLEYSRPRKLQTSPHDAIPVIREVIRLFRHQADRSDIAVDFPGQHDYHPIVDIDPESFRQILWNLLKNAADALRSRPRDRRLIRIDVELTDDDRAVFSVEDDGSGIDEEHRTRIFEPFFTTRDNGTGLGLAITYRLLESQNGQIEVTEPHRLRGARFEISLPLVDTNRS